MSAVDAEGGAAVASAPAAPAPGPLERLLARPRRTAAPTFPLAHEDNDGVTVTFHLTGIGVDGVEALMKAHPSTPEQRAAARRKGDLEPTLDAGAFRAALLAATCTSIEFSDGDTIAGLTAADALAVLARFSLDDQADIQEACLDLDRLPTSITGT